MKQFNKLGLLALLIATISVNIAAMKKPDNINDLPTELLAEIFGLLSLREFSESRSVCQLWRQHSIENHPMQVQERKNEQANMEARRRFLARNASTLEAARLGRLSPHAHDNLSEGLGSLPKDGTQSSDELTVYLGSSDTEATTPRRSPSPTLDRVRGYRSDRLRPPTPPALRTPTPPSSLQNVHLVEEIEEEIRRNRRCAIS